MAEEALEQQQDGAVATQGLLDQFMGKGVDLESAFKPKDDVQKAAIASAVQELVSQSMSKHTVLGDDVVRTIEGLIAELDRKLTEQVNKILHHEDFKALEGTWRGLHYLVNNTETDENLKIKVLNVSKKEAAKSLKKFSGTAWDQSPLFKTIYEEQFGQAGGEPFGCLMGDYTFDHRAPDLAMLKGMAQVAAAAHAPFITNPSPRLLNLDSWQDLSKPRDLTKIFTTPEYAPWRSFRESEDSRYVTMTMPRFLAREPYGPDTAPVEEFEFIEETSQGDHSAYCWSNASWAMMRNIGRSFKLYGWCASIRGAENGGMVEGLPCHTFPSEDGDVSMKCPTEIAITDRREAELSQNGLLPLIHYKNTDYAVFIGGQTVQKPAEYTDPDATANANLSARLPYLFATCRFAHYLKSIVRDKIGSFAERADMENMLTSWISQFICDSSAGEETKAKYPLAEAQVVVEEVEGNPGYYNARFYLRPHYQLEGLTASLRLVSKLPSAKGG